MTKIKQIETPQTCEQCSFYENTDDKYIPKMFTGFCYGFPPTIIQTGLRISGQKNMTNKSFHQCSLFKEKQ